MTRTVAWDFRAAGLTAMAVLTLAGTGRCGAAQATKTVWVSEDRTNVFAVFEVKTPTRLELIIKSEKDMEPKSRVVETSAAFWTQVKGEAREHVWRTSGLAKPDEKYYVRIAGRWKRPPGPGPGPKPLPDWFANAPQCDVDTVETDESTEESPGLVIAKADTAWKTVSIIAGPTGPGVGASVSLDLPEDKTKIIVEVNGAERTGTVPIDPKATTSFRLRSADDQTGTERITLRYEVPGEVYLSDTLVVTVVGDELQIVPEITLVCVGCEKVVWAYRGTTLVDADWFVSFSGSGRIEVKKNNSWITPKGNAKVLGPSQSMTFRGSKASKTATDDVTIEAKEGGETDTEGLYVVSVELTKNWPKNSRILINGQYGIPPRPGMVAVGRPRGLIYHWVYDGGVG